MVTFGQRGPMISIWGNYFKNIFISRPRLRLAFLRPHPDPPGTSRLKCLSHKYKKWQFHYSYWFQVYFCSAGLFIWDAHRNNSHSREIWLTTTYITIRIYTLKTSRNNHIIQECILGCFINLQGRQMRNVWLRDDFCHTRKVINSGWEKEHVPLPRLLCLKKAERCC